MKADDRDAFRLAYLPIVGGVAIAISLMLGFYFDPHTLVPKVLIAAIAELGFAAVIAYVIILFVDRREKEEFRKYVQRNERRLAARGVLSYLLDVDLPKAVSEQLESFVGTSTVVKRSQKIDLTITQIDEDWLQVTQEAEYVAYNASSNPVREVVRIAFGTDPGLSEELRTRAGLVEFCVEKREAETSKFILVSHFHGATPVAAVDPVNVELKPQDEMRVRSILRRIKRQSDNDFWSTIYLCERLNVTVRFDRSRHYVNHVIIHPTQQKAEEIPGHDGVRFEFCEPLLPSNGFIVWWRPLGETGPSA